MTEFTNKQPDREQPLPAPVLLKMLGHLAMHAYEHLPLIRSRDMPLFGVMEQEAAGSPQPLQPTVSTIAENINKVLDSHEVAVPEELSFSEKFTRSARMMQFTNRLVSHEQAFFEYGSMKELKNRFFTSAEKQSHPLSFDQQLGIALELSDNNLDSALTKLWFTSRQYARWLDTVSIHNLPSLTPGEILREMKEWRSSILACKNADANNFQDTSGDSYYAWTHARARVMYGSGSDIASNIGKFVFKHGTTINSHRVIRQTIPSNHKAAAAYGNAIGDAILDTAKSG